MTRFSWTGEIHGYDAWKTRTPPEEGDPCIRCRKHEKEHGTEYCDDCLEGQRLEELLDTLCFECEGRGRASCTCGLLKSLESKLTAAE